MIGIYKITSPSDKIYIGQSWDISKRFGVYKRLEVKCKKQPYLYNSLIKYGPDSHIYEILYEFPKDINQNILDSYEIFVISQMKEAKIDLLNIREGGSRGKLTEITKDKIRRKRKNQVITKESRIKTSEKLKGRKRDPELMKRIAEKNKGKPKSEETKEKIRQTLKNKYAGVPARIIGDNKI